MLCIGDYGLKSGLFFSLNGAVICAGAFLFLGVRGGGIFNKFYDSFLSA